MKNLASLDYAKLLFAFCILFIHTDIFGGNENYIGYVFCQGLLRIAVPFFFIASGYFFYSSVDKKRLLTWFKSNLKIYAIWTLLYIPIMIGLFDSLKTGAPLATNFTYLSLNAVFGFWHLWYFPALIVAALLTTVLMRLKEHVLVLLCCTLYLCGTLLQYRANYAANISHDIWSLATVFFSRNGLFMGFPFFMSGFLIHKTQLRYNNDFLLILAFAAVVCESSINFSFSRPTFDMLFSLPFISLMLFLKVLEQPVKNRDTVVIREHSKNIFLIQIYAIFFTKHVFSDWLSITVSTVFISLAYTFFKTMSSKAVKVVFRQHREF